MGAFYRTRETSARPAKLATLNNNKRVTGSVNMDYILDPDTVVCESNLGQYPEGFDLPHINLKSAKYSTHTTRYTQLSCY